MKCYRATCGVLAILAGLPLQALPETVFVSPSGSDANDGSSSLRAVKTVAKVMQLANEKLDSDSVTVKFLPGPYGAQVVEVTKFPKTAAGRLVLEGVAEGGKKAVFDGEHGNSTWLLVRPQRGQETNLSVSGFVVRNYRGAIQFFGDRFDAQPWARGNLIENNLFENIGQQTPKVTPSFAAVSLINTSQTKIINNTFRNISNLEKCDGLHALYLAGGASNNLIEANTFDGGCGDTIKVRDRSNFNKIEKNVFNHQSGISLFVDSFCDSRKQAECRDGKQECPSWSNVFRGNRMDQDSRSSVKFIHRHVGAANISGCPVPPGGAAAVRILVED